MRVKGGERLDPLSISGYRSDYRTDFTLSILSHFHSYNTNTEQKIQEKAMLIICKRTKKKTTENNCRTNQRAK